MEPWESWLTLAKSLWDCACWGAGWDTAINPNWSVKNCPVVCGSFCPCLPFTQPLTAVYNCRPPLLSSFPASLIVHITYNIPRGQVNLVCDLTIPLCTPSLEGEGFVYSVPCCVLKIAPSSVSIEGIPPEPKGEGASGLRNLSSQVL